MCSVVVLGDVEDEATAERVEIVKRKHTMLLFNKEREKFEREISSENVRWISLFVQWENCFSEEFEHKNFGFPA